MEAELIASIQTLMMLIGDDISGSSCVNTVTLLLGGEFNGRALESWGPTASIEVPQTPSVVTGSQYRREDDRTQEQIQVKKS